MTWQEWGQMSCHGNRAHSRATTAMGDAEGLVQVEMADIGAKAPWLAHPYLGIEVGAVEIHLTAMAMDQGTDVANALLKHPMGGGVGNHQGG